MAQDITIQPLPRAATLAEALIAAHHTDLAETKLLWLVTSGKTKCQPKVLVPFERYLSSALDQTEADVTDGYDLVCVVNDIDWMVVQSQGTEIALVDHLLSHIERHVDDDENVTYKIAKHPIEEFPDVVQRHGLWNSRLRDFGALARQLPLPTPAPSESRSLLYDDVRRDLAAGADGRRDHGGIESITLSTDEGSTTLTPEEFDAAVESVAGGRR